VQRSPLCAVLVRRAVNFLPGRASSARIQQLQNARQGGNSAPRASGLPGQGANAALRTAEGRAAQGLGVKAALPTAKDRVAQGLSRRREAQKARLDAMQNPAPTVDHLELPVATHETKKGRGFTYSGFDSIQASDVAIAELVVVHAKKLPQVSQRRANLGHQPPEQFPSWCIRNYRRRAECPASFRYTPSAEPV
jgi:hypothetical protein